MSLIKYLQALDSYVYKPYLYMRWSKPSRFPGAYWQDVSWLRTFFYCTYAIYFLSFYAILRYNLDEYFIFIIVMFSAACLTTPYIAFKSFKKFVLANEYKVCMNCKYILKGLPTNYRCPECGENYDLNHIEISWKEWFEHKNIKNWKNHP